MHHYEAARSRLAGEPERRRAASDEGLREGLIAFEARDAVTGLPIEGATIHLDAPARPGGRLLANAAGHAVASLPERTSGRYAVLAEASGYEAESLTLTGTEVFDSGRHRIYLSRKSDRRSLAVAWRAPPAHRLAAAAFWILPPEVSPGEHRPNARGGKAPVADDRTFVEDLAPCDSVAVGVLFRSDDTAAAALALGEFAPSRCDAAAAAGRAEAVEPEFRRIAGLVVDAADRPVGGAMVTLRPRWRARSHAFRERGLGPIELLDVDVVTGPDGAFVFAIDAGLVDRDGIAGIIDACLAGARGVGPKRCLGVAARATRPLRLLVE